LLALLALALSLVLWTEGLLGSLERPSVLDALGVRQREVAALAAEGLPAPWQAVLVGDDPRGALSQELGRQIKASGQSPNAVQSLEMALLDSATAEDPNRALSASVTPLLDQVEGARQPLLRALLRGQPLEAAERAQLLAPWGQEPMLEQLTCERLGGPSSRCPARSQHRHRAEGDADALKRNLLLGKRSLDGECGRGLELGHIGDIGHLPDDIIQKVTWKNAAALYGLDIPASVQQGSW
jgi:hypothetical protein